MKQGNDKARQKMKMTSTIKNILIALLVRLILFTHSILTYWRVWSSYHQPHIWLLFFLPLLQVAEALFSIIKRKGVENAWFCLCFFCYLVSTVPGIYLLELDRLNRYTQIYQSQNGTQLESLKSIQGVTLPFTLAPDIWVSIIEQSMLFLMVLGRLLLPRGKLSRDQLSQLLFVYIGMASDNSELFVLFDESPVRQDKPLTYCVFIAWTLSLMLYTVVLTATKSPKKSRVAPRRIADDIRPNRRSPVQGFFQTEIWSIVLTFLLQDGPYLCVRLYTLIRYRLITYSILFFTLKNVFVVILLMYRLFVLFSFTPHQRFDRHDEESELGDNFSTTNSISELNAHDSQELRNSQDLRDSQDLPVSQELHYSPAKKENGIGDGLEDYVRESDI